MFEADIKEELSGGRVGKIHKIQDTVIRPSNKWTRDIHCFLQFLHENGVNFVPEPYSINEKEEIISFVSGEVFNYPLPQKFLKDSMLISAAQLLLKFHNYSTKYISRLSNNENWMLPILSPIEVMCHGDFAPYNVTIVNNLAFGIIDFDTLHPGSRMWDIAYAIYRWIPFESPSNSDYCENLKEQIRKTKLFLDTYGLELEIRNSFVEVLIKRLEALVGFMTYEASNGNEDFKLNIEEGHLQKYLKDIEYLKENEKEIISGIIKI